MRAAVLSGPDVMQDTSHARRIQAFAFTKSDTCRRGSARCRHKLPAGTYEHAELEGVVAERGLVVDQALLLQHAQRELDLRVGVSARRWAHDARGTHLPDPQGRLLRAPPDLVEEP